MTLFLRITIFNIRGPRPTYLWPRLKHFASAEASQKMGYECKILLDLTSGQEVILARRTRPSKMEVSPWSLGLSKYIVYFHLKLPLDLINAMDLIKNFGDSDYQPQNFHL